MAMKGWAVVDRGRGRRRLGAGWWAAVGRDWRRREGRGMQGDDISRGNH